MEAHPPAEVPRSMTYAARGRRGRPPDRLIGDSGWVSGCQTSIERWTPVCARTLTSPQTTSESPPTGSHGVIADGGVPPRGVAPSELAAQLAAVHGQDVTGVEPRPVSTQELHRVDTIVDLCHPTERVALFELRGFLAELGAGLIAHQREHAAR